MSQFKVEITTLAEEEFNSVFQYYEQQQKGLGIKFSKEIDIIIAELKLNPFLFQRHFKHYREAVLKKFPYFIVYEIIEKRVIIHSFFHTKRNPNNF